MTRRPILWLHCVLAAAGVFLFATVAWADSYSDAFTSDINGWSAYNGNGTISHNSGEGCLDATTRDFTVNKWVAPVYDFFSGGQYISVDGFGGVGASDLTVQAKKVNSGDNLQALFFLVDSAGKQAYSDTYVDLTTSYQTLSVSGVGASNFTEDSGFDFDQVRYVGFYAGDDRNKPVKFDDFQITSYTYTPGPAPWITLTLAALYLGWSRRGLYRPPVTLRDVGSIPLLS